MTKASVREMIVFHFDDELWRERLPFIRSSRAPAAGTSRRLSRKSRRLDQLLKNWRELYSLVGLERRREPHMVQQTVIVEKTEQYRADHVLLLRVAESTDDAVRGSHVLDLQHSCPLARHVRNAKAFGNYSVQPAADFAKPLSHDLDVRRRRTHAYNAISAQISSGELLEKRPSLFNRLFHE